MTDKCDYCGRFASKFDNVIVGRLVGNGLSVDEYLRCLPCRDKQDRERLAAIPGGVA